jgi:hypothetical protein
LRKTIAQLNEKHLAMGQEKAEADRQYRILYKQMEKLTQVLDKIKNT